MPDRVSELVDTSDVPVAIAVVEDFAEISEVGAASGTLFQAGSISKVATALLALELVARGTLDLDADVNDILNLWRLPSGVGVSLRGLLTHTAGIGTPFFPGNASGEDVPSLVDVLGRIRVEHERGVFHYSGGGYAIIQQLIVEATGTPFAHVAEEVVFGPLEMGFTSFEQFTAATIPHPAARGDWNTYPEAAAAGLWTTPTDLAKLIAAVQRAASGRTSPVAAATALVMTSPAVELPEEGEWNVLPQLGLRPPTFFGAGLFLEGEERFSHLGGAAGFFSLLTGSTSDGSGAVVMSAGNATPQFFELALAIADERSWHGFRLKG